MHLNLWLRQHWSMYSKDGKTKVLSTKENPSVGDVPPPPPNWKRVIYAQNETVPSASSDLRVLQS